MSAFTEYLSTRNGANVSDFLTAYVNRDDISEKLTPEFKPAVFFIYGSQDYGKDSILRSLEKFNPRRCTHIEVSGVPAPGATL